MTSYRFWKFNIITGTTIRTMTDREKADTRENLSNTIDLQGGIKYNLQENIQLSLMGRNLLNHDIRDALPLKFLIPDDIKHNSRTIWIAIEGKF